MATSRSSGRGLFQLLAATLLAVAAVLGTPVEQGPEAVSAPEAWAAAYDRADDSGSRAFLAGNGAVALAGALAANATAGRVVPARQRTVSDPLDPSRAAWRAAGRALRSEYLEYATTLRDRPGRLSYSRLTLPPPTHA